MHSDTLRYTQIFFIFFICAPSVKISVHPWLLSGKKTEQTHSIGKLMRKNGGKEQNGLRKYSVCAAAQAAKVHNYKHKPRIAGEPAISISRFRDWKPFFFRNSLPLRSLAASSVVFRAYYRFFPFFII